MRELLLDFLLTRLDHLDAPVFSHRELEQFPAEDRAALLADGLLRETTAATEIPCQPGIAAGGYMVVRRTSKGLFGVADEDEPYFDPVPLGEDDIRQYEVSLPVLAERLRYENGIDGSRFENHGGLIPLGQKVVDGAGTVYVYLSLPNDDEDRVLARCQRLVLATSPQRTVLVTPRGLMLSPEGRRILTSGGVVTVGLRGGGAGIRLAIDWAHFARDAEGLTRSATNQPEAPVVRAFSEAAQRVLDALQAYRGHPWPGSAALCRAAGTQRGKRRSPMHRATLGAAVSELVDAGALDLKGKRRPRKGYAWVLVRSAYEN